MRGNRTGNLHYQQPDCFLLDSRMSRPSVLATASGYIRYYTYMLGNWLLGGIGRIQNIAHYRQQQPFTELWVTQG